MLGCCSGRPLAQRLTYRSIGPPGPVSRDHVGQGRGSRSQPKAMAPDSRQREQVICIPACAGAAGVGIHIQHKIPVLGKYTCKMEDKKAAKIKLYRKGLRRRLAVLRAPGEF